MIEMDKKHFMKQCRWVRDLRHIYWEIFWNKKSKEKLNKIINEMCEAYGNGES